MNAEESQLAPQLLIHINDPRWPIARALLHHDEYVIVNGSVYFTGTFADLNAQIVLVNAEYDRQIQDDYERRNKHKPNSTY